MFVYRLVGRRSSATCEPQAKIGLFTGIIRRAALSTNSRCAQGMEHMSPLARKMLSVVTLWALAPGAALAQAELMFGLCRKISRRYGAAEVL